MTDALAFGSVGIDQVRNRNGTSGRVLGGTAYYGAAALVKENVATLLVSAVGYDLSRRDLELALGNRVDLSELREDRSLPSFSWHGEYADDLETATTLELEERLYDNYRPDWTGISLRHPGLAWVYLGAFLPEAQVECCSRLNGVFSLVETLGDWIREERSEVLRAFALAKGVVVNRSEFRELWEADIEPKMSSPEADSVRRDLNLQCLIVTFGDAGAHVFTSQGAFFVPAVKCRVVDTTGAGNVFCGGLLGQLAREGSTNYKALVRAAVRGTVLAGAQVTDFGDRGLRRAAPVEIEALVSAVSSQVCVID